MTLPSMFGIQPQSQCLLLNVIELKKKKKKKKRCQSLTPLTKLSGSAHGLVTKPKHRFASLIVVKLLIH